tara:strand:- start:849 stop:1277 length:429 start_codon:yes stop_codon:yes gene_type:complete
MYPQPIILKSYLYALPIPAIITAGTQVNFEQIELLENAAIYSIQVVTSTGGISPYGRTAMEEGDIITCSPTLTLIKNNVTIVKQSPLIDYSNTSNFTSPFDYWKNYQRMFSPQNFDLTKSFITFNEGILFANGVILFNFIYK